MCSKIILLAIVIQMGICSIVLDSLSQRGLHIVDYCPKMQYCPEGAHVMCMYYDPKHVMGPRCSNPKNVSITQELADKLLDVSNAVRSKIALGKERGKGGNYLPKGYGIFRLKWDSELATFAQVLANQCVLRHDLCRATKRFPDPGQTAGLVRFSYPDWYPVSKSGHFTTPGLNTLKLFYAITQTLKSWYGQKNFVTADMISNYPDWSLKPNSQEGRLYLEMIYGPATHMGCGMSAYTEYAYYDNNAALNYNSVQIICNYSSRPHKFSAVYNMTRPTTAEYTSRCGCPEGSDEDTDCLCHESNRFPTKPETRHCAKGDPDCDPTVVLLPIFTVEDAPPHKLITPHGNINASFMNTNSLEILDYVQKPVTKRNYSKKNSNHMLKKSDIKTAKARAKKTPAVIKKQILDVKNRYFNRKPTMAGRQSTAVQSRGAVRKHVPPHRRQSLFTRVPVFELPNMKKKQITNAKKVSGPKKDVAARKNFNETQELFNNYMIKKKMGLSEPKHIEGYNSYKVLDHDAHGQLGATETILHTAEDKVIDTSGNLHQHNLTELQASTALNGISDLRLLHLLDNLEKEVKNIELHGKEKEIFDAKIRKIYGKVVGRPDDLQSTDIKIEQAFNNLLSAITTRRITYDSRTDGYDKYSDNDLNKKTISRNHNSLIKFEDMHREYRDNANDYNSDRFNSDELPPYRYDEDIKPRNIYKSDIEKNVGRSFDGNTDRDYYNGGLVHRKVRPRKKKYREFNANDDLLSPERKKYYQNKLDKLERKLRNTRNLKHRNQRERRRGVRPMRPTEDIRIQTKFKNQMEDTFYPERARFLHGF